LEKGEPLPGDVAAPPHSATNATAAAGVADDPSVRGMVGRLATRLKQDGSDVDGWIKLIRSYKVMNDDAATTVAVADARKALAGDATKLAKLETGIKAIDAGQEPPPPEPPAAGAAAAGPDHNADDMVQRLAERLQRSGSDPEGWLMLVRSYSTLKEPDKQKTAITNARTALASEPAKLDAFNDAIKRFKLE
jgi:cytochrome c-type biogenesis protein CcmH